jgi:RHS repeat-associated protein
MSRLRAKTALNATAFGLLLGFTASAQAVQNTTTNYQYDALGNLTKTTSPLNTVANPVVTDYLYDALDRANTITQPNPVPGGQRPNTFIAHDGQDQTTQVEDPRLLATDYSVDGLGNVTALSSPDSGAATSSYDEVGNLKTRTDARGKTTTYTYDAQNRLTKLDYPTGIDTVYTYDGGVGNTNPTNIGKLTQISDEAGITSYSYDGTGRLISKTQALIGTQTAWTLAVNTAYGTAGAALGKPSSITYPSGNRINYSYDSAGRINSISLNPTNANGIGTNTVVAPTVILGSIQYTPTGQFYSGIWGNHTATAWSGIVRTDDVDGRTIAYHLGNPSKKGTLRTLSYDATSRVTAYTHSGTGTGTFAPASFNQSFTYDNLGRITAYTGASTSQSYSYDATGNRTSTGIDNHSIDLASNRLISTTGPAPAKINSYDASGNLLSDGTVTYTYSDRGRLSSVKKGTVITNYAYNGLGQRVKKLTGTTDTTLTQYVYDEQGHLLGEYDFFGNPKQETVYLGDLPVAALTQTTTLTGPGAVMVDNTDTANVTVVGAWPSETTIVGFQGTNYQTHIASAGSDSFTWTLNLPTPGKYYIQARWTADSVRGYDVKYTVTGTDGISSKLVNQRTTGNTWTNLGVKTVATPSVVTVKLNTNSTGKIAADAVQALPVTVATSVNYVFADHLGTPRVITRATDNQMLWRWDNADPFGVTQPNTNPAALGAFTYNPRFPGQLYDAETGLYYNYHRSYSPGTGTYTQSDPIGLGGGINTYAYVNNNPVNLTDPTGNCPWCIGAAIGGITGAVGAYNSGADGRTIALSAAAGALGGAFGTITIGALTSSTAFWSSTIAGGLGGVIGNTIGQISGGASFTGGTSLSCESEKTVDLKQVAVQGVIGALSAEYGFIYATTRGTAVAASAIPSLSAATSGAISTTVNIGVPSSLGGLHP